MSEQQTAGQAIEEQQTEQPANVITLGGKQYPARKFDLQADFAAVEQHIVEQQATHDPVEAILPHLEKHKNKPWLRKEMLDRLFKELKQKPRPKPEDVAAYLDTPEGVAFMLWLLIRHNADAPKDWKDVLALVWQEVTAGGEAAAMQRLKAERDRATVKQ